ncbi:MAG: type II toxin-antitoxin system PemK/MazF family toxin [Chloroflexota bacterium]
MVLVSFPFSDLSGQKLRPALIVGRPLGDDVILAFITSRTDVAVAAAEHALTPHDLEFTLTGLRTASRVRLNKVVTLHRALIRRRLGHIGPRTKGSVDQALRYVFQL